MGIRDEENENIARFLQTIDSDGNADNGIQVTSAIDKNANDVESFDFGSNFEADFQSYKTTLFEANADHVALVTTEDAVAHSSKSQRLSSIQEFDLYKAIANEKHYGGGPWNEEALVNSQRSVFIFGCGTIFYLKRWT